MAMLPAYPTNSNIVLNGELITSCTASNTVTAAVVTRTPFINNSQLTVCVGSNYATATPGTLATIRIAAWYPFSSPLPFVSWLDGNITDQTKVVLRKV